MFLLLIHVRKWPRRERGGLLINRLSKYKFYRKGCVCFRHQHVPPSTFPINTASGWQYTVKNQISWFFLLSKRTKSASERLLATFKKYIFYSELKKKGIECEQKVRTRFRKNTPSQDENRGVCSTPDLNFNLIFQIFVY